MSHKATVKGTKKMLKRHEAEGMRAEEAERLQEFGFPRSDDRLREQRRIREMEEERKKKKSPKRERRRKRVDDEPLRMIASPTGRKRK